MVRPIGGKPNEFLCMSCLVVIVADEDPKEKP